MSIIFCRGRSYFFDRRRSDFECLFRYEYAGRCIRERSEDDQANPDKYGTNNTGENAGSAAKGNRPPVRRPTPLGGTGITRAGTLMTLR